MIRDDYLVSSITKTNNYIDIILEKEYSPSYRLYFTYPEGKLTIFSSDYESSYLGLSYIHERKE